MFWYVDQDVTVPLPLPENWVRKVFSDKYSILLILVHYALPISN